ncbi:MAG: cytochrome b/b6 domain-containing protein [Thaumarchaeota archaeon]|nr:cytochrome b/b6 domain-containing protein [Candidatus Calditenuaceae archaeon]MDW8041802.1 cytochrome b/b6 domain-containing protein [Nitrososphaerota archaeon]
MSQAFLYGASAQQVVIRAYRAEVVPQIDGLISEGEWGDTPLIRETVTRAQIAFKHDGQNLYFLAVYEDASPKPIDYYALEFDPDGDQAHMGSEEIPDYAVIVSSIYGENHAKEAILPGAVKPILYEDLGLKTRAIAKMSYRDGKQVVELKRPFSPDERGMMELSIGKTVGVGFAVGEFGMGIDHRATDMSTYLLVIAEERYAGQPVVEVFDLYGLVSTYGPYAWFAALAGVLAHFGRRKAWRPPKYERWVTVERHNWAGRASHWIRVAALTLMIVTGMGITLKRAPFGALTSDVHLWMAFVILLADLPLHVYSLWRDEYKHVLLINRDDVSVTITIAKNFLGLTRAYPPHAVYDLSTGDYYMGRKYCSLQKPLTWFYFASMFLMGLTGFALAYPSFFSWVFALLGGSLNVRAVHLLLFYLFTAVFFVHIYLSLIPANWNRLVAIVRGKCRIPVLSTPESSNVEVAEVKDVRDGS